MNIYIDYDHNRPMYEQIEERIKEEIYLNHVQDNDALPSVRQLSKDLEVSAITVKRAYSDLEKEGFTYSIAGKGTFIKLKNVKNLQKQHNENALKELGDKIINLKRSGVTKREIEELIEEIYKGEGR